MNLKEHLQENGKTDSWINLANQFQVKGTNKQKSDYVRRLYRQVMKERLAIITKPFIAGEINYLPSSNYCQTVSPDGKLPPQPEYTLTTSSTSGGIQYHQISDYPFDINRVGDFPNVKNFFDRTREEQKKRDWEEFKKFAAEREIIEPRKTDGIHLVIGCMHVPFQNSKLLEKLWLFIEDHKSKIIGLHFIGDFLDLKSLSSHDEKNIDTSGWTLGKEYEAGNTVLDVFDAHLFPKKIQKTFLYGNHEDRYFRYVANIKNYKTADAIQSPTQALRLKERGYQVFEDWKEDYHMVGKYQLLHGIYCTVNPAKSHIDKLKDNCLFAHTHRVGEHFEAGLHGANIGTMAELTSEGFGYLSRVERALWKNAFGIINVFGDQSHAEVVVCENNSFFFGGKRY